MILGDCLTILKTLETESIDSLITDPPAGISFMGKAWDHHKGGRSEWILWLTQVMRECLRVMKPGAHGLVWAIPRTSHWTATACEDAGFEIRDVITHIFGSGFPKSLDISKAIDKAAGAEREVVGTYKSPEGTSGESDGSGSNFGVGGLNDITAPSTPEAKKWAGFGTALKPASEHWVLIRKPIEEDTVAANVLAHGTGGINIDASRISFDSKEEFAGVKDPFNHISQGEGMTKWVPGAEKQKHTALLYKPGGRFPANLLLSHNDDCVEVGVKKVKTGSGSSYIKGNTSHWKDGNEFEGLGYGREQTVSAFQCSENCPVAELDFQSGTSKSQSGGKSGSNANPMSWDEENTARDRGGHTDSGGASRFFYVAKPSKREKNLGCELNSHPTVKSTKLMSYLITMITPPNGTVLDPFMGSGTTGVAAKQLGFKFIGIEKEEEYFKIAEARINNILI